MSGGTRLVTDLNGRIVSVSRGAGDLFAIEDRWLAGKPLAAFVAAGQRREFRALLLELAGGAGPLGTRLQLERRDGGHVDVDVEAAPEGGLGDRLEWLLAYDTDATEAAVPVVRVLDPAAVARLLSRLPVGVAAISSELVIEYLNPAARVFLGGGSPGSPLPEPLQNGSLRAFAQSLFGRTPPGRKVVETGSGRLLELEGIGAGTSPAILLIQDVSVRERQSRAEQEFAANAAHELRTPIAAISSALDVLEDGAQEVPADRELFLGHIRRESDRLSRLVAALLLLARLQMGQQTPSLRLVHVEPLLEDVASGLEPSEGVLVRVDCVPGVSVLADGELLYQAVWNVAANAVGHTHEGEVRLGCRDLGALAEIEISDTGSGMTEQQRAHAFDRFYRTPQRREGFGLGLPIAHAILVALGGKLTLESEAGVGTRVRMRLPSARLVA